MTGPRSASRVTAFLAFLGMAGCKYDSSLTMKSAEWDPQRRARTDAFALAGDKRNDSANDAEVAALKPFKTSSSTQSDRDWTFDVMYVLSFPVYLIWDGLLHFVLTDTDPAARPRFDTRIFFAPESISTGDTKTTRPPIQDNERFEVNIKYLAIDYFTGGRLRDAWGGQGGQVSVQTSLNALSDAGMLLGEDTRFIVENEVKRRSPLLAIAKGTAKGREFTDAITERAKSVLEKAKELELVADKVESYVKQIKDATGHEARVKKLEELRQKAIAFVDAEIGKHFKDADEAQLAKQIAESMLKSVFDEIARHLNDPDIDTAADWVATVAKKAQRHLDQANVVLDYFGRYGVDEEGIYEAAKIVVGLADADRRSTLEFENVKPSLLQFSGEAGGGTAATLIGDDKNAEGGCILSGDGTDAFHASARDKQIDRSFDQEQDPQARAGNPVMTSRGLVYRGTLQELSRSMTGVKGISLSFLMLDRGDDRVVRALRTMQQYADQSGITVGGGGAEIPLSSIVEGLAVLSERIAEDKVELRSIDVRFMSEPPRSGATPGKELFALRPCTILISRNLSGNKFGAVAEITISRVK